MIVWIISKIGYILLFYYYIPKPMQIGFLIHLKQKLSKRVINDIVIKVEQGFTYNIKFYAICLSFQSSYTRQRFKMRSK